MLTSILHLSELPPPPTLAEYAAWTTEWNQTLTTLDRALLSPSCAEDCTRQPSCNPSSKSCACRSCDERRPPPPPLLAGARACTLVAVRHIAKTGGVSVREWMLKLERKGRGRFYGPVTWITGALRGRCDGRKRFLHCCQPSDPRPSGEGCRQVRMTLARSEAVSGLAASVVSPSGASHDPASALTMLEFHWPDSALGPWGEPHTFHQMLPRMRPHMLPGCRVLVATVLRDPHTLYPSLQRHQYDAMREYGRIALQMRCQCNLTSCDVLGFVKAFPNFQSWRLTSTKWLVPPLEFVGHDLMHSKASRLLSRLDLVGVMERLDDFVQLVCHRAGISPCGRVAHRNALASRPSTRGCVPPQPAELRAAVAAHAAADVRLHADATARFEADWRAVGTLSSRAT